MCGSTICIIGAKKIINLKIKILIQCYIFAQNPSCSLLQTFILDMCKRKAQTPFQNQPIKVPNFLKKITCEEVCRAGN